MRKYVFTFGFLVGLAKALLYTITNGFHTYVFLEFLIFFLIASFVAVPLWFFRKEKARDPKDNTMELIMSFCTLGAICFGLVHDQITLRVSLEYYTIGHFPVFNITSPTVLGIFWGIAATWWLGLIFGMLLAVAARAGEKPKLGLEQFKKPIILLLVSTECIAWLVGGLVFLLSKAGYIQLPVEFRAGISPDQYPNYLTNFWANGTSYLLLISGACAICIQTWEKRKKLATPSA